MIPILKARTRTSLPSLMDELMNDSVYPKYFSLRDEISAPAVNIVEANDEFRIDVAAPGLSKEDFRVNLENNLLTISSERENHGETENERYLRHEFGFTSFTRNFTLPDTANGEKIIAKHSNGVLSIHIPKREEAKVKPVREIRIG